MKKIPFSKDEEIKLLGELKDKVHSKGNSILVFTGKENIQYRVGITYTSKKYNIIISFNDYERWPQSAAGSKPLNIKKTKEETLEFLKPYLIKLGLKEEKEDQSLDKIDFN